ncbi:stage II sporulation protein M [Candidatus Pacearchaeota archaeon]|nr:stage II sporulation protein M [Candidatus Pacearchaeota archaeon]
MMVNKKKSNKKFSLRKEYKKSWNYLKESKRFIWIVIGIFLAFALIGFFIPVPEIVSKQIFEFIKEILGKTEGMSQSRLISFIFLNNIQSSFLGMVFGVFLGIFPLISAIANGYLLGFVANFAIQENGILSLWRILPHGIFELPAVFISFALGLRIGASLFNKKRFRKFNENFVSCLKVFVLIVIPLLIIAAIIEGTLISLGA